MHVFLILPELSLTLPHQNWHVFAWIAQARISSGITKFAIAAESWGWLLEWSPAMIGSGFLVDIGVACSFFAGAIFAWYAKCCAPIDNYQQANFWRRGLLGPYLVFVELAFGKPSDSTEAALPGLVSYTTMSSTFSTAEYPSPRYWLLWPGVACTLAVAFLGMAFLGCSLCALIPAAINGDCRASVPIQQDLYACHYCNEGPAAVTGARSRRPLVSVRGCRPRPGPVEREDKGKRWH